MKQWIIGNNCILKNNRYNIGTYIIKNCTMEENQENTQQPPTQYMYYEATVLKADDSVIPITRLMKWESQHKTKREFMIKILQELDE
jgi:hypothetical protein